MKQPSTTAGKRGAPTAQAGITGVGQRLIEARADKELTRPALAKLAKVPYPTLAGLENGDQSTSTHIPALASALGVSALWLATGKEPKHADGTEATAPAEGDALPRIDPWLISRVHRFLAADHAYDLADPGEAALFASAYEWLAQQDEATDSPQSFNRFLRWAAVRNISAPKPTIGDQAKGSATMNRWRSSLNEFASTGQELSQTPAKDAKLSTK